MLFRATVFIRIYCLFIFAANAASAWCSNVHVIAVNKTGVIKCFAVFQLDNLLQLSNVQKQLVASSQKWNRALL